ncbi:MAG: dienelactone hydrolase family protein [Opitutaceae bacterium]
MLLSWGGRARHIPPEQIAAATGALKRAAKSYVNVEIPDASHGFFRDERPSFSAQAAMEAWALTLAFPRAEPA